MFAAQTFYSDDNGRHYAGIEGDPNAQWPQRLKKYASRGGKEIPIRLQHCPAIGPENLPVAPIGSIMSYGVNSAMMLF